MDVDQMKKIRRRLGSKVKILEPLRKFTLAKGWFDNPGAKNRLAVLGMLGSTIALLVQVSNATDRSEIDTLCFERRKAGNDMTQIGLWVYADLQPWLAKITGNDKVASLAALAALFVYDAEAERLKERE